MYVVLAWAIQVTRQEFVALATSTYLQFLEEGLQCLIEIGEDSAFCAPGHNGPHLALESPVRNSCHWLLAFAVGHRLDERRGFREAALALSNWVLTSCPYFVNGGFILRQKDGHDWCNGVIGSAWIIEALVRAGQILGMGDTLDFAAAFYKRHRFNDTQGAWHRFDVHSGNYNIDATLDHQAWFAAAAAELGALEHVERFLDACQAGAFHVRADGRIHHLFCGRGPRERLLRGLFMVREARSREAIEELEIGYHHYTLHPFARIRRYLPGHSFWRSDRFLSALAYLSNEWLRRLEGNRFGWPYNAPGFELPILIEEFGGHVPLGWSDMSRIFDDQLHRVRSGSRAFCGKSTKDPLTLTARIYELGLFLDASRAGTTGSTVI